MGLDTATLNETFPPPPRRSGKFFAVISAIETAETTCSWRTKRLCVPVLRAPVF
jgi:hypothetical protein